MAQRRRKEQELKKRQRLITALCIFGGIAVMLVSVVISLLIFNPFQKEPEYITPVSTPMPYDVNSPFSLSDLTPAQLQKIRRDGSMHVSDGPRGVSVGDSLEKLMGRYPSTITEHAHEKETTGLYAEEEIILYCAEYFENQNGHMTVLPPRGLLTVDNGQIIVTLLAPTSAYPPGTHDNYGSFEHVYAVYTIEPDTMVIEKIVLGIDR